MHLGCGPCLTTSHSMFKQYNLKTKCTQKVLRQVNIQASEQTKENLLNIKRKIELGIIE